MHVLIIAPHMDDEVLGCGGTVVRHLSQGDTVTVCIVANRAYDHQYVDEFIEREKEAAKNAQAILGYQELIFLDCNDERLDDRQIDIIVPIEEVVQKQKPDVVYFPHRGDLNQDHRAVFEAVRVACRPFAAHRVNRLVVYEVPSSTDQVPGQNEWPFLPNRHVDIQKHLEAKLAAMGCYEVEGRDFPHPRSLRGIEILARKRGMEVGMAAAEAFMVLRDNWFSGSGE